MSDDGWPGWASEPRPAIPALERRSPEERAEQRRDHMAEWCADQRRMLGGDDGVATIRAHPAALWREATRLRLIDAYEAWLGI